MTNISSTDIGRLAKLRSGKTVKIRAQKTNIISATATARYQHSGGGVVYSSGYADPLEVGGVLSPSDVMLLGDLGPDGKPVNGFTQGHMAQPGYYDDEQTKWAIHSPVPWINREFLTNNHRAWMARIFCALPVEFREVQFGVALFSTVGRGSGASSVIPDAIFGSALDSVGGGAASRAQLWFQVGVEKRYQSKQTGLTPPEPVMFGNNNYLLHDYSTYAGVPVIWSKTFDMGRMLEKNEPWGLWTMNQQAGTVGSCLPQTFVGGNYSPLPNGEKRYDGYQSFATDALGTMFAATSIANLFPSSIGGGGSGWAPIVRVKVRGEWRYVGMGTSLIFGDGEANRGSEGFGDIRGSVNGNRGWLGRAVGDVLGEPYCNVGKSSDRGQYYNKASQWFGRAYVIQQAAPEVVVNELSRNDITNAAYTAWATSQTYELYETRWTATGCYICTVAGAGATSGAGPATTANNIVDASARWDYLWPATTAGKIAMLAYGIRKQLEALVPNAILGASTMLPSANSTNEYRDAEHQTVQQGFGDETSDYGQYNNLFVRANLIGYDFILDLEKADIANTYEAKPGGGFKLDGKWKPNASRPFDLVDTDATHPNGKCAKQIGDVVAVDLPKRSA